MPKPSSFETAFDSNNNFPITLGTTIAGEDIANDVTKVEQRFNYLNISTSTTTTVKTGVGLLHSIIVTNVGATSNSIKVYDNTAASGTVIVDWSTSGGTPVAGQFIFDCSFTVGLTIVTAGTTAPNLTVTYR